MTVSSSLSATFQAACSGANEAKGDITGSRHRFALWDDGRGVPGVGRRRKDAWSINDLDVLCNAVSTEIASLETFGALDTLEYLRRGGRIGSAQAFFGSLLSIKPIVELRNGVIEVSRVKRNTARNPSITSPTESLLRFPSANSPSPTPMQKTSTRSSLC